MFSRQAGRSSQPASGNGSVGWQAALASSPVAAKMLRMNRLIDSHAHLDGPRFEQDLDAALERAGAAGVDTVIAIGVDLPSSLRARELAYAHPGVWASAGVHPHDAAGFDDDDWPALSALWADPRVRAVGETGLDYYYDRSPRPRQQELFRRHLEVAGEVGRPVVIHVRDAFDDAFAALEAVGVPAGGVVHCFAGGPAECERALALGLHISISGMVTMGFADPIRAAVPLVPDDRILVETDSPFLAPKPHRGQRNEPAYVVHTARRVAELRGVSYETLCGQAVANTERLFGLTTPARP